MVVKHYMGAGIDPQTLCKEQQLLTVEPFLQPLHNYFWNPILLLESVTQSAFCSLKTQVAELVERCRLTQSLLELQSRKEAQWNNGQEAGMQGLCHRGVSSFLCSGGNAAGLQTPVARQLNPKKGVLLEGEGKWASEPAAFPEILPLH